jgi:hypothetical protein
MNSLIIIQDQNASFDPDQLERHLCALPGVSGLQRGVTAAELQCSYDCHGVSTLLHLSSDCTRIALRPFNDAGLQLALELQKKAGRPLYMFDEGADFYFYLTNIKTLPQLWQRIKAGWQMPLAHREVEKVA